MHSSEKDARQAPAGDGTQVNPVAGKGPGRRRGAWKLFVAWVLVPPMLLCVAEMGLRLAGVGVSMQLFIPRTLDGTTVCMPSHAFFQQFYTLPFRRAPHEFSMPAVKPPNTFRVFVFGSSAAQGHPAPDFAFSRILGTMLRAREHGMKTEIYSLALGGSDSHVMRAAAKACAKYQPDLFLVYMGNNELNPRVVQTVFWDRLPPALALFCLHMTVALNDSRLLQMMRGITGPADLDLPRGSTEGGREPERAYTYYQANVNDICAFAKSAGARVLLCTMGTRLRECIPMDTNGTGQDGTPGAQWGENYEAGNALREKGLFKEALAAYSRARETRADHAGLAYGIACCHYGLCEYADARQWYVRARDLDFRRNRATSRINTILRTVAADRAADGVFLLDAGQSLADTSPHGIEGTELFLDHVHFSFEGNYILARSVLDALSSIEPPLAAPSSPLSVEECRLRLAMSPPDLRNELLCEFESGGFTGVQPTDSLRQALAKLDGQIGSHADEMRLEACRKAIEIDPGDQIVRIRHVRLIKDPAEALDQAKRLCADFPYSWEALRLLARAFGLNGERQQAIGTMRRVLALCPDDADAYMELGQYLAGENQYGDALSAFNTSYGLRPSPQAKCKTGRVLLRQGKPSGAMKAFQHALKMEPGDAAVLEDAVTALCATDCLTEANGTMERWSAEAANKKPGEAGSSETNSKVPDLAGPPMDETDTLTRVSLLRKLFRLLPYAPRTAWKFQDHFVEDAERLETAGDLPGAVHAYRVAIPFNPQNDRPIRALEKALSKSSPAEQRGVWDAAFKDNPGIALVAALCGAARAAAGDTAGAREAFDTARRLAPEDWYYCVLAADTFAAAGAWDDAIAAYEHALTLNPKLDYLNGRLESAKGAANRPPGAQAP